LSPDYPDHLAEIVDGLLTSVGFTGPMGIYLQDYGGPIGNRLIEKHPTGCSGRSYRKWNMGQFFLARPNAHHVQLDLFCDYRTNATLCPTWPERLRTDQPKTLIFWGQGDIFFTPEGGEVYLRDLPDARMVRLNSGHFTTRLSPKEATWHRPDTGLRSGDA
jgi:hypothetical protein